MKVKLLIFINEDTEQVTQFTIPVPKKTEYTGDKGNVTETIDTIYDGVSNAAMAFGPIGMLVGGAMASASLLGKGFNALGGGTDGKTT